MQRIAGLFVVLPLLCGCGARVEVAKDKILASVDKLLGEIDVKRKEAEINVRNLAASVEQLKRGKIEAKVRTDQLASQIQSITDKTGNIDKTLERLATHLKSDKDVEINGKTYTKAKIKEMADQALSVRKNLTEERKVLETAHSRANQVYANLEQRESAKQKSLKILRSTLDEIDMKATALKSLQESSRLSGSVGEFDFGATEKQVTELSTKLDRELMVEAENTKDQAPVDDLTAIDSMLKDVSTNDDTLGEIEKTLGKK